MDPTRGKYWLLDSVAGWQIASTQGIVYTAGDGDIALDPIPGKAVILPTSISDPIKCPVAVAGDKKGRLFVLDASTARIFIADLTHSRSEAIPSLGGLGSEVRHFNNPRSLTVLPSGGIAVADTGNARVQVFSGPPYALLHVWGAPHTAMKPCAVASDTCGDIYMLDRQTRSILRVRPDGEWLAPIGVGTLTDPVELAVASTDRTVAVVDGRGANAVVVIFPPNGDKPVPLTLAKAPLSLAFDDSGNLYVGTANAIVSKLIRDTTQLSGWSLAGDGVSDYDGSVTKLAWIEGQGPFGILNSSTPGSSPRLFSMSPDGAYALSGSFVTQPLESRIETCAWHRVQVIGTAPAGTSLTIESSTSDNPSAGFTPFVPCMVSATGGSLDCLVQSAPGRFLQLKFTLQSAGTATPRIHALKVFFPRQSYLQYLPAVFQDDDESRLFLDRFLSIFQTTFDAIDNRLDTLWQVFNPFLTPDRFVPWLAAWMDLPVDPGTPLAQQRKLLAGAFQTNSARGTIAGLTKVIQDYTGVTDIRILEHYRLRDWTALPMEGGLGLGATLWSRNFYARLQVGVSSTVGSFRLTNDPPPPSEPLAWGANQFSVLFPADPYLAGKTSAAIQPVLEREQPAWTQAFLCPIYPRLRVGIQATLGIDSYVGRIDRIILGKLATLRYDSVLSPSPVVRDVQALGVSQHPRIGVDATIL